MSETLFSMILSLARMLPGLAVVDSKATSDGAAGKTTLVDAGFPFYQGATPARPGDDYYNGGTIFFKTPKTAPGNQSATAVITNYIQSSGTFEFLAVGYQTKIDDTYAVVDKDWPLTKLREAIYEGEKKIGGIDTDYEDAAFVTVEDQMEYDLPTGVRGLKRVFLATCTTAPYEYVEIDHSRWYERASHLRWRDYEQPGDSGYRIKLVYSAYPTDPTSSDASVIPDAYPTEWLRWAAAVWILRWRNALVEDEKVRNALVEAITQEQLMDGQFRPDIQSDPPAPEYGIWS
jgi:hypothetical protein